ncbi:MAG: hypothetical protein L6W00_14085 [Lentisphaeria bacterium]|nr:MAG: hypothetical protein L6W00_14085 [Lentisphaeria bacterium]
MKLFATLALAAMTAVPLFAASIRGATSPGWTRPGRSNSLRARSREGCG